MSTRCNTAFYYEGADSPEGIVYRHWDGYPGSAGADLIQFLKEVPVMFWRDPSYLSAHYLVWLANKFRESDDAMDFMSVGIINDTNGYGCDYRYQVWSDESVYIDGIRVVCLDRHGRVVMDEDIGRDENYKEAAGV
jgi:hypothetical protein